MTEYCNGGCGHKGEHKVVYCVECNLRMDPCDEMPNPIEAKRNLWLCEECAFKLILRNEKAYYERIKEESK